MIQVVCSVFDSASQLYSRPFFVAAAGQAVRSFTDEVNRRSGEASELSRHPDDFTLFRLGFFDDVSGDFTNDRSALARGKDVVISEE